MVWVNYVGWSIPEAAAVADDAAEGNATGTADAESAKNVAEEALVETGSPQLTIRNRRKDFERSTGLRFIFSVIAAAFIGVDFCLLVFLVRYRDWQIVKMSQYRMVQGMIVGAMMAASVVILIATPATISRAFSRRC